MTEAFRRRSMILVAAWTATIIAIWPILFHWTAPAAVRSASIPAAGLGVLAAVMLGWLFYRFEIKRLAKPQVTTLLIFIFLLTAFCEFTHHWLIDLASNFSDVTNAVWQEHLQSQIARLDPNALPHSYRFLPNAIVFWMQIFRVRFHVASEIYRTLTTLILFYSIYRFGRLYTTHFGAIIAMLLVGLVYPVSFVAYAGQLTDPLSHLSFLLAFIFIETDEFLFFLSALLIGSLAKETVLGLMGFYLVFSWKKRDYRWKAPILIVSCLAAYFGVRTFVLHGALQYRQVSGVDRAFIVTNLEQFVWVPHFIITGIAYLPFLILGWKDTPPALKKMTFYLLPLLLISSALFSWLNEARNYMPLVFVLAVVAGRYLMSQANQPELQQAKE